MPNRYLKALEVLFLVAISSFQAALANEILSMETRRQLDDESVGKIVTFRLIDADSNLPIMHITNGQEILMPIPGSQNFNIDALTAEGRVGSILFGYLGDDEYRLESRSPFAVCGDDPRSLNYKACPPFVSGKYVVVATPFSEKNALGTEGTPVTLSFTVTTSKTTLSPTFTPTNAPIKQPSVAPLKPPTKAPIRVTTIAPRIPPTHIPVKRITKAPTKIPIKISTKAPAMATTAAPVKPPTNSPRLPPTKTPTKVPIKISTNAPISVPKNAPTKTPTRTPTKAPTRTPTRAPISNSTACTIPKFVDEYWQDSGPRYPIRLLSESQGLLVGNDMVVISGFLQNLSMTTNHTYARNVLDINSPWRRMDDMPVHMGITHAATLVVGTKVYLCGGYIGGHPGPHVPNCFVYDHSVLPGQQQQWSHFTPLPNGGSAGGGMIYDTARNSLYYTGGGQRITIGSAHPVDIRNTWKYQLNDPKSGWVASTPFPYLANHLSYVTHTDGLGRERHFFLGGQVGEVECCANFGFNFEFVASTETWVRRSSMPIPRGHASSSTRAIGCGFVIAGGSINSETTFKNRTDDISYYDIPTNTWTTGIGTIPRKIATPVVDIHSNGFMYFVTGYPINGQRRITV